MTKIKILKKGSDWCKARQNRSIHLEAMVLNKMSFKDEMGKMIFNLCCSIWSDQGYYHKLVIFHQNSKYDIRKRKARKISVEWNWPNFSSSHCLLLRDHQSCVFRIDMQPTTYWHLVSHKFKISDKKMKG